MPIFGTVSSAPADDIEFEPAKAIKHPVDSVIRSRNPRDTLENSQAVAFPDLDSAFHQLINAAHPNRFIEGFFDIITLIFHYHYQWNKADERKRNAVALAEHVTYIDALLSRDPERVEGACKTLLASARHTWLRATRG